eukprot:COSAG06_NODE_53819_length_298_cov_0.281407_1_plen_43_part_10
MRQRVQWHVYLHVVDASGAKNRYVCAIIPVANNTINLPKTGSG